MPSARARIAGSLAALAAFGLVLAPVLHAQLHASEAEQEQALGWSAGLADASGRTLSGDTDAPLAELEADHHHGDGEEQHRHSHGPGAHGAGSLEHLALAVHAAADPPAVTAQERVCERPPLAPVTLHLTPRYLVPDFSQGPPR